MAKILSSCIADNLTYIAEHHSLLSNTHFGGCPGQTTIDSLYLLTKFTHDTWAHPQDRYVSMLFLNVKAVFPSVIVEHLIHNMRSHSILKEYTDWYENRLAQCTTTLSFDDFIYNPFNIPIGLDQGYPISPIAFLFYNAPLIELADNCKYLLRLGFINDTAFAARGQSFEDMNKKLCHLMEKMDDTLTWS